MTPPDSTDPSPTGGEFELVLLCTGNRIRSPIAEAFLRQLLVDLPVRLRSLGVLNLGAASPVPDAIEVATAAGLNIAEHRARALEDDDLSAADLVVGFERHHSSAAVVDGGARRERVFTLPELVELIEDSTVLPPGSPIERAHRAVAAAHALRSERATPLLAELTDPLGQARSLYTTTVTRIQDLTARLAVGLFGREAVRLENLPTPARAASETGGRRGWSRGR
jgi:protein-tyrosine-phosphatase